MTDFVFDDYARTTLSAATNAADGKPLTPAQIDQVISYLKSPGSGPDGTSSYADYLARQMRANPPRLPANLDYVGFSGVDGKGVSNFQNAETYIGDIGKKAGIIGDTPWGRFINELGTESAARTEFRVVEGKFQHFMELHGYEPRAANYAGALQDMMWNAGSPEYFENAIAARRPIVAFVENAPPGRGFSNFELSTALKHPDAVINGYPVRAFGNDPLAFASQSAAEFQQLERSVAQAASSNSGKIISVQQVRANLSLIEGYDAVGRTLFNQPVDAFKALSFDEMAAARSAWSAARGGLAPGLLVEPPGTSPRTAGEPGAPRGPPAVESPQLTGAKAAAEAAPDAMLARGLSPSGRMMLKGAGAAGIALMAYDFASSGHKVIELRGQGNDLGAESTATHFVGRNVGGVAGGVAAGFGYGLLVGSETGPGAIITGIGGGIVGAYFGERWAQARDNDKVFKQTDGNGVEWARDPDDPQGRWLRSAATEQIKLAPVPQASTAGAEVAVSPRLDSDGDAVFRETRYVASGNLARQLNYQSANASYALGLANPADSQNPYRLPSKEADVDAYVRDAQSGTWSALHSMPMEHGMKHEWTTPVTAQKADELQRASDLIVAQNAANSPAAVAARYQVAYDQFGWHRDGPVPEAIQHAAASAGTLRASDGDTYTRGADGEWTHDGWLYDSKATGNVRAELDAVYQSQQAGVADMQAIAQYAREHPQPEQDSMRGLVADLYKTAGVPRTDAELDAAVAAVQRDHARDGLGQRSYSLELMPDPATNTYNANSPIASYASDENGQMVLTSMTTGEEMRQATPDAAGPSVAPAAQAGQSTDQAGLAPSSSSAAGQFINDYAAALERGDFAQIQDLTAAYAQSSQFAQNAAQAAQVQGNSAQVDQPRSPAVQGPALGG